MNPLFGSGLPYRIGHGQQVVMYMALGRSEPPKLNPQNSLGNNLSSESSDSGSWVDDFPLHRYAIVGNGEQLSKLIRQGLGVNRMDADSWAPIHYAAW